MINKVSQNTFSAGTKNYNPVVKHKTTVPVNNKNTQFADSFLKNAKETAPVLLALTGLWSLLDYGTGKISMAKSLRNNLAFFFIPVLTVSSALVAGIENKKTSKSSKT